MAEKIRKSSKPHTPMKKRKYKNPHPITKGRGMGTGAGKPKAIETPELLWKLFEEYVLWSQQNPYKVHTHTVKGKKHYQDRQRALTQIGFAGYLAERHLLSDFKKYVTNTSGAYDSYSYIIADIKNVCSNDTISGAMANVYNGNLASRLEGLVEKKDVTTDGDKITGAPIVNIYKDAPPLASDENEIDK
jgi:hypothetical protein